MSFSQKKSLSGRHRLAARFRRAFTLVEILLATTLMTVVIIMVVQILGTVMNAWDRANTTLGQNSEAALILDTIGRDLAGSVIRTDGNQKWFRHTRVAVEGRQFSNLVFLSSAPDRGRLKTGANPGLVPGNVSTLSYAVVNLNPVKPSSDTNRLNTICRYLTPPEQTFAGALANFTSSTWETVRASMGSPSEADSKSLLASNIYGFDLSYAYRNTTGQLVTVPSKLITTVEFPLVQSGVIIPAPEYFEITITILSETGAAKLEAVRANLSSEDVDTIVAQESRQFSRRFFILSKGLTLTNLIGR